MRLGHSLVCFILLVPSLALAAPAHAHGAARMDLAVEGDRLTIAMEMPLDNMVGFEHLPRTAREKAALAESMRTLGNAAELFIPTPEAGCKPVSAQVGDPFPGGKAKADGHSDMDADYAFRCANPAALSGVKTTLFRHFRRLQRIDVQRVTPSGQGAARMTPEQPAMSW